MTPFEKMNAFDKPVELSYELYHALREAGEIELAVTIRSAVLKRQQQLIAHWRASNFFTSEQPITVEA